MARFEQWGAAEVTSDIAWSWHWPEHDILLRVSTDVADTWWKHRQAFWQHERGGQLFATVSPTGDLVLASATPPHRSDRASWAWLELDPARCRAEIAEANAAGQRLVGTWHTHPQRVPSLSPMDCRTMTASARVNRLTLPSSLAVIVGYGKGRNRVRAWRVDHDSVSEGRLRS